MIDWSGKVALVTGASSGMGAATAHVLASSGAQVFTAQRRDAGYNDINVDLADPKAPKSILETISKKAGRLDLLVNNAGIMREGNVEETSLEDWHAQIHMNLTTPFLLIRESMKMLKQSQGAIVNVGSIEGLGNNPRHPAYGASKAGLHGLTRAVAVDAGAHGVRCNAVAPGWIDTPLNEDFIESMPNPKDFRARLGDIHPMRRTGTPEDVARLIVWLGGPEASWVTGQIWAIDGGRTTQLSLP